MNNNLTEFKKFLADKDIFLEEIEGDEDTILMCNESIEAGLSVSIYIVFANNDSRVGIVAKDYIKITDLSKRTCVLEKINELNSKSAVINFLITDDNYVITVTNLIFYDNFIPQLVLDIFLEILNKLDAVYKEFMKIIWS